MHKPLSSSHMLQAAGEPRAHPGKHVLSPYPWTIFIYGLLESSLMELLASSQALTADCAEAAATKVFTHSVPTAPIGVQFAQY